jgi:hypothetical protein
MFTRVFVILAILASVYGACPTVPSGRCNICGAGECVSKPNAPVNFPGYPATTCIKLQAAGLAGKTALINTNCKILPQIFATTCGCNAVGVVSRAYSQANP